MESKTTLSPGISCSPFDFERHVIAFDFERQPCNADKHCPAEDVPNWYSLIDFNFRYSSSRPRSSIGQEEPKTQNAKFSTKLEC